MYFVRLEANPNVRDVIADPAWIPILDEFQRDPQAAMIKYRDDRQITETLRELCNVLGKTEKISFVNSNGSKSASFDL